MNTIKRRKTIIQELEEEGVVKTVELSERLGVSSMTIRRDLSYLAEEGIVSITHGGAVLNKGSLKEHGMLYKEDAYLEEKRRIGEFCSNFINEGDAVFLDTGSTAKIIADVIADRKNISVVTHSLLVQQVLAGSAGIRLISAPGVFREKSMGFLGQMTCEFVTGFKFDTLFLGVEGVDIQHGVTVPDIIDGETKRALVRQAKRVIVVADSSKIGVSYFMSIAPLDQIHTLVTNKETDPNLIDRIRELGVEVFLV